MKSGPIINEALYVSENSIILKGKTFVAYELSWQKLFSLSEKISNLDDFLRHEEMPFNENGRKYIFTDLIIGNDYELWEVLEKNGWQQLQNHGGYWKRDKGVQV